MPEQDEHEALIERRREYVAEHLEAVYGHSKLPRRPKRVIMREGYEHAKENGLMKEPYFSNPSTEEERWHRWETFCVHNWGGVQGLRSRYLPELGCVTAFGPEGVGRANKASAEATREFSRKIISGVTAVENLDTENANRVLGLDTPKVRLSIPSGE